MRQMEQAEKKGDHGRNPSLPKERARSWAFIPGLDSAAVHSEINSLPASSCLCRAAVSVEGDTAIWVTLEKTL